MMITPSRWFSGGKGLDNFRDRMLGDDRFMELVDFPQLYDVFPGVKIRGGISYPLEKRTPVRDIQAVGTAAGAIWNPIAAARRLSDAMLRWRCISS